MWLTALSRFVVAMSPRRYTIESPHTAFDEDETHVAPVADQYSEYQYADTESQWVPVGR